MGGKAQVLPKSLVKPELLKNIRTAGPQNALEPPDPRGGGRRRRYRRRKS